MFGPKDVPLLSTFLAVADARSFSAAARSLGLAKSAASQRIKFLEERCGAQLFERSTRSVRLTQVGEELHHLAREVMQRVELIDDLVEGHRRTPTGTLKVTMPSDPSLSSLVASIVAELIHTFPQLRADLRADDTPHNLIEGRFDVALRLGTLPPTEAIVRRLGSEPEIVVASPALFEQLRPARTPHDLQGAPWVSHSALPSPSMCTLHSRKGDSAKFAVHKVASASSIVALRDLIAAGVGYGVLPLHVVRDEIEQGRLNHVCPQWFSRSITLFALMPSRRIAPRVRLFLDRLILASQRLGFEAFATT